MAEDKSQEKSYEPTDARLARAREEGEVPRSRELTAAVVMMVVLLVIRYLGRSTMESIVGIFSMVWHSSLWSSSSVLPDMLPAMVMRTVGTMAPLILIPALAGLVVAAVQVGGVFSFKAIFPDLGRLDPSKGISRIFSSMAAIEMAKVLIKIVGIGYIGYSAIRGQIDELPALALDSPNGVAVYAFSAVFSMSIKIAILIFLIAAMDYGVQRWEHKKKMMMTQHEYRKDQREQEGDPRLKSFIRGKQIAIVRSRMITEVHKADVVVTNPEHIAVAIKFDPEIAPGPVVLAKGADYIAERIKEVARENDVPIFENPPLARAIYGSVGLGDVIPEELYTAVAQILVQVYRMKGVAI
jgi:flagellar biosynthetic protein FlhB